MTKITILGVGAMGSRIAQNFLNADFEVTIYNRSQARTDALRANGAKVANSPKEAVKEADFVLSIVRDVEASREIWLADATGAIHGLKKNTVAIESSTVTPLWVKELSKEITRIGAAFLEAPMLGTRPQAEAKQLIYLVGGDETLLEKTREVLQATSGSIYHLGEIGAATVMKLAVNAQYGVQVAIWAETLSLLEKSNITPATAVEILNALPTTSAALQIGGKLMAAKNYSAMFPIELVEKDFGYALELAKSVALDTPTLWAVRKVFTQAIEKGYGNDNIVGLKQLYDEPS